MAEKLTKIMKASKNREVFRNQPANSQISHKIAKKVATEWSNK